MAAEKPRARWTLGWADRAASEGQRSSSWASLPEAPAMAGAGVPLMLRVTIAASAVDLSQLGQSQKPSVTRRAGPVGGRTKPARGPRPFTAAGFGSHPRARKSGTRPSPPGLRKGARGSRPVSAPPTAPSHFSTSALSLRRPARAQSVTAAVVLRLRLWFALAVQRTALVAARPANAGGAPATAQTRARRRLRQGRPPDSRWRLWPAKVPPGLRYEGTSTLN